MSSPNTSMDFVWKDNMNYRKHFVSGLLESHFRCVRFDEVIKYASKLRSGIACRLDEELLNTGANNAVRVLNFDDGVRWIARFRYHPARTQIVSRRLQSTIDTMQLVREHGLPVPEVYGYDVTDEIAGRPFILMELIKGNSIADVMESNYSHPGLFPGWKGPDPHGLPLNLERSLALFQVRLSNIRLKAIGRLRRPVNEDLIFDPARAMSAVHTSTRSYLEDCADGMTEPPPPSKDYPCCYVPDPHGVGKANLAAFPQSLKKIAATFEYEKGDDVAFPLVHPNLNVQSVLVDDDMNLVGVVDWDDISTMPWALNGYPECGPEDLLPEIMDDSLTERKSERIIRFRPQGERYIRYAKEAEDQTGSDHRFSAALENRRNRALKRSLKRYWLGKGVSLHKLCPLFPEAFPEAFP